MILWESNIGRRHKSNLSNILPMIGGGVLGGRKVGGLVGFGDHYYSGKFPYCKEMGCA
jgi:hypothetical protein